MQQPYERLWQQKNKCCSYHSNAQLTMHKGSSMRKARLQQMHASNTAATYEQ
jgi:hypothetical protein